MNIHSLKRLASATAGVLLACAAFAQQPAQPVNPGTDAEVFVQTGNSLQITAARFSPDGQWVASCDGSGTAVVWDAVSGRQFREAYSHTGMCMGVAFTPDGGKLITTGGPRTGNEVVMTRWVDGTVLQTWTGHSGLVRDARASADSQGAWTLGERDGLFRWKLGSAAPVQKISTLLPGEDAKEAPSSSAMALSADQKRAWVGRTDGSVIVLDLTGAAPAKLLFKLPEVVSAIALSPDERMLALSRGYIMGAASQDVALHDAATGAQVRSLAGHSGTVFALAFSPDGRLLASAAQINTQALLTIGMKAVEGNEALRVWRVSDGAALAEVRNQRNVNGTPFLRGSLDFAPASTGNPQRLVLALWDEAARIYEFDAASPRLLYTLEGRGLAPRQLQASDASNRLLVTDGRPRVKTKDVYMDAATVRREFGSDTDWTEARVKRLQTVYSGRGWLTQSQRAAMWDMTTGRLEQVLDWQRAPVTDLGLDAQGRFVSLAPLFPQTTMVSPLKTRIVREARAGADGKLSYSHFGYEPWDGAPDALFIPLPGETNTATAAVTPDPGSYQSEVAVLSPTQRWSVIAGWPILSEKDRATSTLQPRIFIQDRGPDGARRHRHDIAAPGRVMAMAVAADERTLWAAGTLRGLPYSDDHEGWLIAVDLETGTVTRQWQMPKPVTVDKLLPHPGGDMVLTNGMAVVVVWDKRQAERKYRVEGGAGPAGARNMRAMALTADGRTIATADLSGYAALWDWPEGAAPTVKWQRQLPAPHPHLLSFMNRDQRIAAGSDDGSVRILGRADGAEIARMIRFDNGEWITMIPEGYFVASQEGDRWVNVRRGGRVYGVDQFFDVFYRPDIVERKLAGQPIDELITVTLEDALRSPPPKVAVEVPASGAPPMAGQKIKVALQLDALGGGVGELRVLHNGKLVEVLNKPEPRVLTGATAAAVAPVATPAAIAPQTPSAAATAQGAVRAEAALTRALRLAVASQQDQAAAAPPPAQQFAAQVEIELVPGENSITAIGFNGPGNLNARPLTRVLQAGGTAPPPRVFVLAVGINKFQKNDLAPDLKSAVKDSNDFAQALRARIAANVGAAPVEVRTLQGEAATRAGLDAALAQLQKDMRAGDLLVWFVASHGTLDNNAQYGLILQDWDGRDREASLFSTQDILGAARRIRAFNQLVILDTCHAGGVSSLVRGLYDARLAVLARNMGLHVFASASATEEAWDSYKGNGLFTHALLQGLAGAQADADGDHRVTIGELGAFARRKTMDIATDILGHAQEPLMMNFGKDVTIYATD